jgi:hypothetical protein
MAIPAALKFQLSLPSCSPQETGVVLTRCVGASTHGGDHCQRVGGRHHH